MRLQHVGEGDINADFIIGKVFQDLFGHLDIFSVNFICANHAAYSRFLDFPKNVRKAKTDIFFSVVCHTGFSHPKPFPIDMDYAAIVVAELEGDLVIGDVLHLINQINPIFGIR